MKKTLTLLAFFSCLIFSAQSPQFINYQAILRDAAGVPIAAGTTVNLNVKIFNDGTASSLAYEENHNNITIPAGNVINIGIGKGVGVPPNGNFGAIQWNLGLAEYLISLNGTPLDVRSKFASVPFALNAGGASTNYSPSANVSITGNILDLTDKLTGTVSVGSNQNPNSKIPMFAADQKGRIVNAGEYIANTTGDIAGRLDSQIVKKLNGIPLSLTPPTNGQVLQFNGANWAPGSLTGSGPWSYNAGIIFPSNSALNDKVAIGSGTATSMLDVRNSGLSSFTSGPIASFVNSNPGFNPGSGVVSISHQVGSGAALFVQNMNSATGSDGINVQMSNNTSASDGIRSTHIGPGRAGNFVGTSQTSTVEVLGATGNANVPVIRGTNASVGNSSLAVGIWGRTQNSNAFAAGVYGENLGAGSGVVGTGSGMIGAVVGVNLATGAVQNANGVNGLSNSTHTLSAGMWGESKGAGFGVYGINTSTLAPGYTGVYGTTTGTFNTNTGVLGEIGGAGVGVRGINKGTGNSIQGTKPAGVTLGSAGRFEINDNANASAAMLAITQGAGAAVQAMAGTPATSALSLLVMNGHMKAGGNIGTSVALIGFSAVGNYTSQLAPLCSNCNDVRGEVTLYAHTTAAPLTGNYIEIIVPFAKPYAVTPIVVVSPTNDHLGMQHMVSLVTPTEFRIRIFRANGQTFPASIPLNTPFSFSYYVME